MSLLGNVHFWCDANSCVVAPLCLLHLSLGLQFPRLLKVFLTTPTIDQNQSRVLISLIVCSLFDGDISSIKNENGDNPIVQQQLHQIHTVRNISRSHDPLLSNLSSAPPSHISFAQPYALWCNLPLKERRGPNQHRASTAATSPAYRERFTPFTVIELIFFNKLVIPI